MSQTIPHFCYNYTMLCHIIISYTYFLPIFLLSSLPILIPYITQFPIHVSLKQC
jgi:hypothetical protein